MGVHRIKIGEQALEKNTGFKIDDGIVAREKGSSGGKTNFEKNKARFKIEMGSWRERKAAAAERQTFRREGPRLADGGRR